jgi:tetratricopeptide (TPR) repeat protein
VRIIMRCLERDPAARYQSAYEILADLQGSRGSASGSHTVQIQIPEFVAERRWTWVVGGVLLLLILAFAIPPVRHLILRNGGSSGPGTSGIPPLSQGKFVAILPFRVLGDDQSLGYVAEGLNEALSAKLFQLKNLRLASETAVAKVSEKDPLEKTARALGVNLIVQGMIQGSADKMAIIISLINVADGGKKLWSQQFTGVPKDLLTLEDQISGQLVTALDVKPSNEELARTAERPTDNVDAYDLFLRGRQALRGPEPVKAAQTAIDYFQGSIQKDPNFALAYTGLASACLTMYHEKKDPFWAEKALGAAQRAEQLKDNLPEVHFSLGTVYLRTGKTAQAIVELKRGLELSPNSDEGYLRLGKAYMNSGQKDLAIATYKKAIEVNPYYWGNRIALGNAYFSTGDTEKALEEYKRVTELEPGNVSGWDNLGNAYLQLGRYEESIPAYKKSIEISPTWSAYNNLGYVNLLLGRPEEAVQMSEKAVELGPNQELAVGNLADAYRGSGQKDKANATYDKAIALAFQELQVNPQSTAALEDLALYYAKKGEAARGMEFIQRARGIDQKDVELVYAEATVELLAGKQSDALRSLREAFSKGFSVKQAQQDPEFKKLKDTPEFQAMVKEFGKPSK